MAVTIPQFRTHYPEFASSATFPNSQIQYYMDIAGLLLNRGRWMRMLDVATELFVAHNIALEAKAMMDAQAGGIPGEQTGPTSSKSVDKVSISYDTGSGIETGAGHWNLTIYGTRFIRLVRMFGAGPIQLGIGQAPPGSGQAWTGPSVLPGFTNFGN